MDADKRQDLYDELGKMMNKRARAAATLNDNLKEFSTRLFAAIEKVIHEAHVQGVRGLGKPRRLAHPAGGGREGLQIFIEDWSIIFIPMQGFARPNIDDEARIPPVQFKELCARIGVFLTDDPKGRAFYDFVIFQDHSWFAWGYGWPKQQAEIVNTDFEALALELVHSFVEDIFVTWYTRAETVLADAMAPQKQAYEFGLPGEEQQGG